MPSFGQKSGLGRGLFCWLLVGLILLGGTGCSSAEQTPGVLIPADTPVLKPEQRRGGQLKEVSPPVAIQKLRQKLEDYRPQVKILSPKPDEVLNENQVSVRIQVKDLPIYKDPKFEMGPHLQVFIDDQPFESIYDLNDPLVIKDLQPGSHSLRVFAARPWNESFKNDGAYAQSTFHVFTKTPGNLPNPDLPLVTYGSPQGDYGAEPIMLDFYLQNAPLHFIAKDDPKDDIADWSLRTTINGESFRLDRWQPIYLKGFKPGQNWLKLEFLDENGDVFENVFNTAVRLVNYQPGGKDTLAQLVQGKLTAEAAMGIVDPALINPVPVPEPKAIAKPAETSTPAETKAPEAAPAAKPEAEKSAKPSPADPAKPGLGVPIIPIPAKEKAPAEAAKQEVAAPQKSSGQKSSGQKSSGQKSAEPVKPAQDQKSATPAAKPQPSVAKDPSKAPASEQSVSKKQPVSQQQPASPKQPLNKTEPKPVPSKAVEKAPAKVAEPKASVSKEADSKAAEPKSSQTKTSKPKASESSKIAKPAVTQPKLPPSVEKKPEQPKAVAPKAVTPKAIAPKPSPGTAPVIPNPKAATPKPPAASSKAAPQSQTNPKSTEKAPENTPEAKAPFWKRFQTKAKDSTDQPTPAPAKQPGLVTPPAQKIEDIPSSLTAPEAKPIQRLDRVKSKAPAAPKAVMPKTVAPKTVAPKTVTPKTVAPKVIAPKPAVKAAPSAKKAPVETKPTQPQNEVKPFWQRFGSKGTGVTQPSKPIKDIPGDLTAPAASSVKSATQPQTPPAKPAAPKSSQKPSVPTKNTPAKPAPAKPAPTKPAPAKSAPAKATPAPQEQRKPFWQRSNAKKDKAPSLFEREIQGAGALPSGTTLEESAKAVTAPKAVAPKKVAPKKVAPPKATPQKAASKPSPAKVNVPKRSSPKTAAPNPVAPQPISPKPVAPKVTVPKSAAPKPTAPKSTAPKSTAPKTESPKATPPKATAPKDSAPAIKQPSLFEREILSKAKSSGDRPPSPPTEKQPFWKSIAPPPAPKREPLGKPATPAKPVTEPTPTATPASKTQAAPKTPKPDDFEKAFQRFEKEIEQAEKSSAAKESAKDIFGNSINATSAKTTSPF